MIYFDPSGLTRKKRSNSTIDHVTNPNIDYGNINKYGQRSGIIAEITPQMLGSGTSANHGIEPPGWINGKPISEGGAGQARSHLLAKDLGGSGDVESNLVTFLQNPTNNSDMKTFEQDVKRYVDKNQESVYYQTTPLYNGTDGQPYGVVMEAVSVDGDGYYKKKTIIENEKAQAEAENNKSCKGE